MMGMLWFYWRRMVRACKIFVDIICHGDINSFLIIIPNHMNSTEKFTIPTNSDIIVFLNLLIRWSALWFLFKTLVPKSSTSRLKVVGHVQ